MRTTGSGAQGFQILIDHRKSGGIGGFYGNGTGSFHALAYGVDVVRDAAGDPVRLTVDDPATSVEPASTAKKEMLSYAAPAEDLLRAWRWDDWNEMTVRCTGRYPVLASWVNGVKLYEIDTGAISHPGYDRDAARAAQRQDDSVDHGTWIDPTAGKITLQEYAQDVWLPSRHLEVTTRDGYRSYLRNHFVSFFGHMRLARIMPSTVQEWVTLAVGQGLSARSIAKYYVMLHSVFARAVRDRIIAFNPREDTELQKVVTKKTRILTPQEFESVLAAMPDRFKALVLTDIETGLRWGELVALRPRHIDFLRRRISVEETIVEVSRKDSPTGERMIFKPYPKDDEPRTLRVNRPGVSVPV